MNLEQKAKHVLEVYLARGQAALVQLRAGQVDAALGLLQLRKAAYHNFRVIDQLAADEGVDLSRLHDFAGLLSVLQSVDIDLKDEMQKARNLAAEQAKTLSVARRKISKYRSAAELSSRFEQSV